MPPVTDDDIIDNFGGTVALAALCKCSPAAPSQWRRRGIPQQRRDYLELLRPECFTVTFTKLRKRREENRRL